MKVKDVFFIALLIVASTFFFIEVIYDDQVDTSRQPTSTKSGKVIAGGEVNGIGGIRGGGGGDGGGGGGGDGANSVSGSIIYDDEDTTKNSIENNKNNYNNNKNVLLSEMEAKLRQEEAAIDDERRRLRYGDQAVASSASASSSSSISPANLDSIHAINEDGDEVNHEKEDLDAAIGVEKRQRHELWAASDEQLAAATSVLPTAHRSFHDPFPSSLTSKRTQILVLGMHHSGTSLIAKMLMEMNLWAGRREELHLEAGDDPPKWFERKDVINLNLYLCTKSKHEHDVPWLSGIGYDSRWMESDAVSAAVVSHRTSLIISRLNQVATLEQEGGVWFIKEPRLSISMGVWRPLLNATTSVCVLVYRDGWLVARGLYNHWRIRNKEMSPSEWLALWEKYTLASLRGCTGLPLVLVSHEEVARHPIAAMQRLASDLHSLRVPNLRMPSVATIERIFNRPFYQPMADHSRMSHSQRSLFALLDSGRVFNDYNESPYLNSKVEDYNQPVLVDLEAATAVGVNEGKDTWAAVEAAEAKSLASSNSILTDQMPDYVPFWSNSTKITRRMLDGVIQMSEEVVGAVGAMDVEEAASVTTEAAAAVAKESIDDVLIRRRLTLDSLHAASSAAASAAAAAAFSSSNSARRSSSLSAASAFSSFSSAPLANLLKQAAVNDDNDVVALYANSAMVNLTRNALCHMQSISMNRVVVLALDADVCPSLRTVVSSSELMCYFDARHGEGVADRERWSRSAKSGYYRLLQLKMAYTYAILDAGFNLMLSDVDTVYLSNPLNYIHQILARHEHRQTDLVIQSDVRPNLPQSRDWVCAGNFYIRATRAARDFVAEVMRVMAETSYPDQDVFQLLLTSHGQEVDFPPSTRFVGAEALRLKHVVLDPLLFPNGGLYFVHGYPQKHSVEPILVHANMNYRKERMLKRSGLWLVSQKTGRCLIA